MRELLLRTQLALHDQLVQQLRAVASKLVGEVEFYLPKHRGHIPAKQDRAKAYIREAYEVLARTDPRAPLKAPQSPSS